MRQNIQRIDHVVFVIRPENIAAAASTFSELLGITFEPPYEPAGFGIRVYIDWSSGVELIPPVDLDVAKEYAEFLEQHGEGLFRLIFGVADLDDTLARAGRLGYRVRGRFDALKLRPEWEERFQRIDESIIDPCHGVRLNFGQVEPKGAEVGD